MPLASWLFLRGNESIWVERPLGYKMVVAGPGPQREEREFTDEEALQDYQISLAGRLSSAGWFLAAFDYERRQGRERRTVRRNAADRRLG